MRDAPANSPAREVKADGCKKLFFFHTSALYLAGLRFPMLKALTQAGYEVVAFAPDMTEEVERKLAQSGIEGKSFSLTPTGFNPVRDIADTVRLASMLRREAPRIVFSNNIKPVIFATFAAFIARIPVRHALVGGLGYAFIDPPVGKQKLARRVIRIVASMLYFLSFRMCRAVIFHNADDKALLVGSRICPRDRAEVVPGSGVDVEEFVPGEKPPTPTFIFVGRLLVDKGVREYLSAARVVKARYPLARFLLVGPIDPNPAAVEVKEVEGFVAAGDVDWVGGVSDVRPYLHQSSVFVLPSYREGVPRSTLEAMACGLAVITTDAPGCRDTVEDGRNGLLVPVGSVDALASAISSLCEDSRRVSAMGNESRAMALSRFSTHHVNEEILGILERSEVA